MCLPVMKRMFPCAAVLVQQEVTVDLDGLDRQKKERFNTENLMKTTMFKQLL